MQKRVAVIPPSQVRPTKRRRRTATEVLAGYFDPRPQRDFFTDMANINDTTSAFNSILGHGPGIIFDTRSNEEMRMSTAGVQDRLRINRRELPKETVSQRPLDEHIFRNTQRQVGCVPSSHSNSITQGVQDQTPVASASTSQIPPPVPSDVEFLSNPPVDSYRVLKPQDGLLARSTNPDTPPFHSEQLQRPRTSINTRAPLYSVNTHVMNQSNYTAESHPHRPPSNYNPVMTPITTTATRSSASQIASPPTPARSVASFSSNTSSRRPRTPEDDGGSPFTSLEDHQNNSRRYETYPDSRDNHALLLNASQECRGKYSYRGPSPDCESSRGDIHSPNDQDFVMQTYSDNPNWQASPPPDIQSDKDLENQDSTVSPIMPLLSPMQDPSTPPSFAHRRNALSLAGLLSPPARPYQASGFISIVPPTPEASVTPRQRDPPVKERFPESALLSPALENKQKRPSVASMSTIDSPCVSPLDVYVDTTITDSCAKKAPPSIPAPASEQGNLTAASIYIDLEPNVMKEVEIPCNKPSRGEVASESEDLLNVSWATLKSDSRETSIFSDHELRHRGKRSKAMLIIESDDETTDNEDDEVSCHGKKYNTTAKGTASSAPKVEMLGESSARREESLPDAVPSADYIPSPVVRKGIPKKKPAASRKGWKGWVEVEVDEHHRPPKQFSLDTLLVGERRTRSGKQFDA